MHSQVPDVEGESSVDPWRFWGVRREGRDPASKSLESEGGLSSLTLPPGYDGGYAMDRSGVFGAANGGAGAGGRAGGGGGGGGGGGRGRGMRESVRMSAASGVRRPLPLHAFNTFEMPEDLQVCMRGRGRAERHEGHKCRMRGGRVRLASGDGVNVSHYVCVCVVTSVL